jgi:hypothetical protein
MGKIMSFNNEQIGGLSGLGMAVLHVEVGDDGSVHRELGLNTVGAIVHRYPGTPTVARHGLFDLQSFEAEARSDDDMPAAQFAALWER